MVLFGTSSAGPDSEVMPAQFSKQRKLLDLPCVLLQLHAGVYARLEACTEYHGTVKAYGG